MKSTCLLVLCCGFVVGLIAQPTGKYAFSGLEKICLNVYDENKFELLTSNCTFDFHHTGSWVTEGDTLVLDSDVKPRMQLLKLETAQGDRQGCQLMISCKDPLMLRTMKLVADGRTYSFDGGSFGLAPQSPRKITLMLDGFEPFVIEPEGVNNTIITAHIKFEDLHIPYLENDRWLIDGRTLHYIPPPGSNKSEDIIVKRGKRCWYKNQMGQ